MYNSYPCLPEYQGVTNRTFSDPAYSLQSISTFNTWYTQNEKFNKNSTELLRENILRFSQSQLYNKTMLPLTPKFQPHLFNTPLPDSFLETAQAIADSTGLVQGGCCLALAAMISVAMWGRIDVQVYSSWVEPCVDQVIEFGHSGMRKSAAIAQLIEPILVYQTMLGDEHKSKSAKQENRHKVLKKIMTAHDNSEMKRLHSCTSEEVMEILDACEQFHSSVEGLAHKPLAAPSLLLSSTTEFGLMQRLYEQGECQAVVTAEGGMLLDLFSRAGDLVLKTHTKEAHSYRTGRGSYELRKPAMPMCCFPQLEVANKLYGNDSLRNRGGTARIIPFFHFPVEPVMLVRPCGRILHAYNKKILSLLELFFTQDANAKRCTLHVEPAALDEIKNFEAEIRSLIQLDNEITPWLRKLHGQAVRFACGIHVWNNDDPRRSPISAMEMLQGIELARIAIPHAFFAFLPVGLSAYLDAQKIVKSLLRIAIIPEQQKILTEGTSTTAIRQRTGLNMIRINNALHYIAGKNMLFPYDDGTGIRRVAFHPCFFTFANPEKSHELF